MKTIMSDILCLGGVVSAVAGCFLAYHPLGFVVGGAFALYIGINLAKAKGKENNDS